jgi:hypothetical protein
MQVFSAVGKLMKPEEVVQGFAHLGWNESYALGLAITELSCTAVYLFSRTAILGAILLTGHLGGATATHVGIGDANRRLLEIVCLNCTLDGATLVRELRKPFDVLAEGLLSEKSRGDWTAIELFLAGVRGWKSGLHRCLDDARSLSS